MRNEHRPGTPPVVFLDIQIPSRLEQYPFHSAYSLAEILKVSPTAVVNHLRDTLGTKHVHLRWIPHELTEHLRAELIKRSLRDGMDANAFRNIAKRDKSWFTLELQ
jgi:predicted transcriptional regulator